MKIAFLSKKSRKKLYFSQNLEEILHFLQRKTANCTGICSFMHDAILFHAEHETKTAAGFGKNRFLRLKK